MSTTENRTSLVESTQKKYRDKDWLENQYREVGRTQAKIAEVCGCSRKTIQNWISKFGLRKPEQATFRTNYKGYERWRCWNENSLNNVAVHRLLATLKVDELDELDGKHIHHKSHIPWLNTLESIEVMEPSEHREHHRSDEKPEIPI